MSASKSRALKNAYSSIKEKLEKVKPKDTPTCFVAFHYSENALVEVNENNIYTIMLTCLPTIIFSKEDISKLKLYVWKKLNKCLNYREAEILWRIQHGAFLTPPIAQAMGLTDNCNCIFCGTNVRISDHIFNCNQLSEVWDYCNKILERAGHPLTMIRRRPSYPTNLMPLNHILHTVYSVIYERIWQDYNRIPPVCNMVGRLRQIIFDLIYTQLYKSKMQGDQALMCTKAFWEPVSFLFVTTSSGEINISLPK